MTRRTRQNIVIWIATLLFIGSGLYFGPYKKDLATFIWVCVGYGGLLVLFAVASRFTIPKEMRKRPEIPADFHATRIGPMSDQMLELQRTARLLNQRMIEKRAHSLHEISQSFPNGDWICHFEVADGWIIARIVFFRSSHSPFLDYGHPEGEGTLLSTGQH